MNPPDERPDTDTDTEPGSGPVASSTQPPGVAFRNAVTRQWTGPLGLSALALIVVQAVWRGMILGRGFFTQDDFLMMSLSDARLSGGFLFQGYSGHIFPGGFAIFWLQDRFAPLNWGVSVLVILVLQALSAVTMWAVLRRLLPGQAVSVLVLTFYLFCPLTLWSTQWWAVAVQFLPVAWFLLLAVWALLCRIQDGTRWGEPLAVLAVAASLAFQERGILIPLVLGFLAVGLSEAPTVGKRLRQAFTTHVVLWGVLLALTVGYLFFHRSAAPITSTTAGSAGDDARLVANFLFRNVLTGLFGGPWSRDIVGDSMVRPAYWAVALCALLFVGLVVWTVRRGGATSAWGWSLIVVYSIVDVALLFGGRTQMGATYGMLPRYAADGVPAFAIGLALVALAVVRGGEPPETQRPAATSRLGSRLVGVRRIRWLPIWIVLVYAASAAVSTSFMAPYLFNHTDRRYVQNLRAQLRENPQAVIYDGLAPDAIMIGWFGGTGRVSTVIGTAPESPVFDVPSYEMRLVDGKGKLREFNLVAVVGSRKSKDQLCGYHVTKQGVAVPLEEPVQAKRLVLRIAYYTSASGPMTVELDGKSQLVPMRRGAHRVDLVVGGSFDEVSLRLDPDAPDGATVCVPSLQAGYPVAARD